MRQMIEDVVAAGAALLRARGFQRGIGFFSFRLGLGERGLQLLQRKRQLVVGDALRLPAEVGAPDLGQDLLEPRVRGFQPRIASVEQVALDRDRVALDGMGEDGGRMRRTLGRDQSAKRVDIPRKFGGQRVVRSHHRSGRLAEDKPSCCRFCWLAQHRFGR